MSLFSCLSVPVEGRLTQLILYPGKRLFALIPEDPFFKKAFSFLF